MRKWIPINLNDRVRVKVTEAGHQHRATSRREFYASIGKEKEAGPYLAEVDADGTTQFSLWSLMNHFGSEIGLGRPNMFETTFEIEADLAHALPPLDDALTYILGRPNFVCCGVSGYLRERGHSIAPKAEAEQAAVIHWMLGHYLAHGPEKWQMAADAEYNEWLARPRAES